MWRPINDVLQAAIHAAAGDAFVAIDRPDGSTDSVCWGEQVDVRPIAQADQFEDAAGEISEGQLAGYIAKYATKGTGKTEGPDKPIYSQRHLDHLAVSEHHRAMIQTAWDLGGLEQYEHLNLRRWAHMLAFRGHFLTKSQRYSTTFRAIRDTQRAHRLAERLDTLGLTAESDSVAVVNDWRFTGAGYRDDAERELAAGIATRIRDERKQRHEQEHRR